MLGVKLFILLFVVIIAEAQYQRLPHTTKPWEASKPISDISLNPQTTGNLTQNTIGPDVIVVYPETLQNKTSFNLNFTMAPRYPTSKPITSIKDYNLSHFFTKHDQEEELDKVLKERRNSIPVQIQDNPDELQPESKPNSESDLQLKPKLEPEIGQESKPIIEANSKSKPDNKYDLGTAFQSAMESDKKVRQELKLESDVEREPETTAVTESQPEADAESKTEVKPVSQQQQKPKTNTESTPEISSEKFLKSPIYKPSENINETELKSKEKAKYKNIKSRPRPTYPGYYITRISTPSKLDRERPDPEIPIPSTLKPSSQTLIPLISTRATVVPPTAHNLSMTSLRPDVEIKCTEENAYHAIPYECDTFVECKQYVVEKYTCPDGLLFNSKAHWPEYPCAYPSEVECDNKTIIQDPEPVGECPRRFGTFPSQSEDCGKYVVCDDGRAVHMSCPNGLAFNPISSGCDWPENVPNCKPKVFEDFTCPSPPKDLYDRLSEKVYNYKYQDSCKEYIACSKGEPRLLRCDSGLSFDEISKHCIESKLVKNCEGYPSM